MSVTAPGWYPDPDMANTQRYWDGDGWTDKISPVSPVTPRVEYASNGMVWSSVLFSIFIPIIGFVLGIVLCNKNRFADGVACMVLSLISGLVYFALLSQPPEY